MATDHIDASEREQCLDELVVAYLEAVESGVRPNRQEWLAKHPEFADELAEFFADQDQLDEVVTPLRAYDTAGTSVPALPRLLADQKLGDYRIIREIGRGGMGIVYEAAQVSLGRRVALKVLPFAATFDEKHLQRFRHEAQAAALLHHSHIVPVYAVGCESDVHFYAMQFIEGQSLAEVIAEQKKDISRKGAKDAKEEHEEASLAPSSLRSLRLGEKSSSFFRLIAQLGLQAAEALEHAHQFGVVHRDIKPANLLIDDQGDLWITDFGLARLQGDTDLTRTGDVLGTLRYMSPEQALAKRGLVGPRTDIYWVHPRICALKPLIFQEKPTSSIGSQSVDPAFALFLQGRADTGMHPHLFARRYSL